jgi:hypothetical protein
VVRRCPALRQETSRPSRVLVSWSRPFFVKILYAQIKAAVGAGARATGELYFPLRVVMPRQTIQPRPFATK